MKSISALALLLSGVVFGFISQQALASNGAMDAYLVKYIVSGKSQGYEVEFSDRLARATDELRTSKGISLAFHPYRWVSSQECLKGCKDRLLFTGAGPEIQPVINEVLGRFGIRTDRIIPAKTVYVGLRAVMKLSDGAGHFDPPVYCDLALQPSTDWRSDLRKIEDAIFAGLPSDREARMKWFKSFVTCPFDESRGNAFDLITVLATEPRCAYSEKNPPDCMLDSGVSGLAAGYPARH